MRKWMCVVTVALAIVTVRISFRWWFIINQMQLYSFFLWKMCENHRSHHHSHDFVHSAITHVNAFNTNGKIVWIWCHFHSWIFVKVISMKTLLDWIMDFEIESNTQKNDEHEFPHFDILKKKRKRICSNQKNCWSIYSCKIREKNTLKELPCPSALDFDMNSKLYTETL